MDSEALKVSDNEEIAKSDIDKHFNSTKLPSDADDVDNEQLNEQNPQFIQGAEILYNKDDKVLPDVITELIDDQCELMNKNGEDILVETDVHKEVLETSRNSTDIAIFNTSTQGASDGCVQVVSSKDEDSESGGDVQLVSDMDELEIVSSENEEQDILSKKKELPKNEKESYTNPLEKFPPLNKEKKILEPGQGTSHIKTSILDVVKGLPIIPRIYSMKFHLDISSAEPLAVIQNIESCVGKNVILNIQARFPDEFCLSTLCENTYQKLCKAGFMFKDQKIKVHPIVANVRGLRILAPIFICERVIKRSLNKKFGHIISMKCFRCDSEENIWLLIIVVTKPIPEEIRVSDATIFIEVGDSTF